MAAHLVELSIIIPVYCEGEVLLTLLHRLQPLRSQQVEIIVVDGHGLDAQLPSLRSLCDDLRVTGAGRAHQMNLGAEHSSGRRLLFLHADSEVDINCLAPLTQPLPSTARWGFFHVAIKPQHWLLSIVAGMMNLRSSLTHIATGDQGLWVHRDLFERVQGFPGQWLMEDIAICAKLRRLSAPQVLPGRVATSARRWQTRGLVRTMLTMWWLRGLYALGVPANCLARRYYPGRVFGTGAGDAGQQQARHGAMRG